MTILKKELEVTTNNNLNSYFPVRTNNSGDAYDWRYATAIVIRNLYQRNVSSKVLKALKKSNEDVNFSNSLALLSKKAESEFSSVLDEEELWPIIEDMYLKEDVFKKLAPESALFGILPYSSGNSKNRLADLFLSIMSGFHLKRGSGDSTEITLKRLDRNFLEEKVVDCLRSEEILDVFDDKKLSKGVNEKPYLPYLTSKFKQDLELLGQYPAYLIENLTPLLKLYGFLYTSQLALNINGWRSEPKSRPVFFIMENETASRERSDLISNGYQNLAKSFKYIFPFLSVSESLQEIDKSGNQHRLPLWDLASRLEEQDAIGLKKYTKEFHESRNLKSNKDYALNSEEKGPEEWLKTLLEIALDQFNKGESRAAAQGKFLKAIEQELCSEFYRSRGQLGKILVINQDYLSLLTNVCIGKNERLRFHELLKEFEARGVYFDKQSQQSLIVFYERVGNVERMSDSGDAVYVRKTV